ncbi:two-component regulator propeller domain-containing protein [uncultured Lacinutrix sp.]|uniref:ligand-binding sensor domain-containing protein n=1 Tax=uncultured Lacinutrix sp. TaxID=574032 RepID=UPI002616AC73|nr:sensor histidine kinase [uncultured Lacinutrix sp.]
MFLLLSIKVTGQQLSQKFIHYGKQDGLNQSSVNFIFQDSENYLWIANFGGINRFDGYEFTSYINDFDNINSIPDNSVWSIYERKDKTLWFGTKAGLSKYNREQDNFKNYFIRETTASLGTLSIKALFEDSNKRFYVGTEGEGLFLFNEETKTFSNVDLIPKNAKISAISEDNTKNLWIATENLGVFVIDSNRLNSNSLLQSNIIPSETIWSLLCDTKGYIWLGTDTDGLLLYNTKSKTTINFKNNKEKYLYDSGNKIKTIAEDKNGRIWIGSATEGLAYYSKTSAVFFHYKTNPFDSNSLFDNDVSSLFFGNSNELYVGLYTKGFNKLITTPFYAIKNNVKDDNTLSNNNVYCIYKTKDQILWMGTFGGGLNKYNPKTKRFKHYRHNENNSSSISHDWVRIIFEDSNNTLWVGTWGGGLNKFDKTTETFRRYLPNSNTINSINHNIITALFEDEDGKLWIGTYGGGINIYRPETDDFISIVHEKDNINSISDDHITSFFQGEDGLIWICTYGGGINSYDKNTKTFKRFLPDTKKSFSLNNHKPLHIYKEPDSSFYWVTTLGGGINKFFYKTDKFENYTEKDGLSNNSTMGMLKDYKNNYWISSNNGISQFNPKNKTFQNYTTADGLASDDYNLEAYTQTNDGTMYFGGKNGVTFFNPKDIKKESTFPKVVITRIKVEDSIYNLNSKSVIVPYKNRLLLNYAVINANNVSNIKYAYQLVGQDNQWREMGEIRYLEFTNLQPKNYELRIKSTNSNAIWNNNYSSFKFKVTGPWYMSWYFRAGTLLFILLSVFSYYKIKLNTAKKRNIELEHKVEARTKIIKTKNIALAEANEKTIEANEKLKDLNELKDRILSIVSHDMKSPLLNLGTLLVIFEDTNEAITEDEMSEYTGLIQKELSKVQALLDNLLVWAKYQITNVNIGKADVALNNIVDELYSLFESKAAKKNLKLVNAINNNCQLKNDENIIRFILRNLIYNAIKFTPENGEIKVENKISNGMYSISVIDSGVGMDESQQKTLFSNNTVLWKEGTSGELGTGLGLILCKELSEELNGAINVNSKIGKGTTITFQFPV